MAKPTGETYKVEMNVNGKQYNYAALTGKEAAQLFHHFVHDAHEKVLDMIPDNKDDDGANNVVFTATTTRESDGKNMGDQTNNWHGLSDAAVGALTGAWDGALKKLPKPLASKQV